MAWSIGSITGSDLQTEIVSFARNEQPQYVTYALAVNLSNTSRLDRTTRHIFKCINTIVSPQQFPNRTDLSLHEVPDFFLVLHNLLIMMDLELI